MGIGDWVTGLFGSENKERAKGFGVNSDAYQYGQDPLGAENAAEGYAKTGADAQSRGATQAGTVDVNYAKANADRNLAMQSRGQQNSLAQVMANRATGGAPTVAQMQADRQMGQLATQQASMAGSARGAGGLAAAQRNAAFNTANGAADISGQAQVNSAGERRDDTNAAAGMFSNLRSGDVASQGQDAGQSQFRTQNAVQQNQFNAGLRDSQAARNDARQFGYDQMANQVRTTQLGAGMNEQAQRSANALGAQGINAGVGGQNASMNQANAMQLVGMTQSAASIPFMGGGGGAPQGKAVGGPVQGGTPYIVGEKGPELIVPPKDGFVLTADQTKQALGVPHDPHSGIGDFVRSTWGNGPKYAPASTGLGDAFADANAADSRGAPNRGPMGGGMAIEGFSPGLDQKKDGALRRQDEALSSGAHAKEAQGIDPSEREAYEAQGADYRLGRTKKNDRAEAAAPQRTLASVLGDMGKDEQKRAATVDTAYHGGGGHYVPPQFVPLRAMGGPVQGGMPFIGGEKGPEMLVPLNGGPGVGVGGGIEFGGGGISHNDLLRAGTGLASPQAVPGMVGGGGITGGSSMGGHAIPGGDYGGAREEGGPVESDKVYLTGEAGPEVVVPKTKNEQTTADTKAGALDLAKLAAILSGPASYSPVGAGVAGAQALGVGGAAAQMSAEDAAARKAREDQAALDADRAEMNRAERGGGPAPAHSIANTVLAMTEKRPPKEIPWRKQRSLWDILKGGH